MASISNASSNELGKITGGTPGDQTGKEIRVIGWYNPSSKWDWYIEHPSDTVMEWIAVLAEEMAANDKIGYDQGNDRDTYWAQLQKSQYRPKNIKTACECDCSSGVATNVKAVGYLLDIPELKKVSHQCWTGNILSALVAAGFKASNDSKYLTSDTYVRRGGILLNLDGHVTTFVTSGSKPTPILKSTTTSSTGGDKVTVTLNILKNGSKGEQVRSCQQLLIAKGYDVGKDGADGAFGANTLSAVKKYQKASGLDTDGIVGKDTWGALLGV